jgi:hypothetical protein
VRVKKGCHCEHTLINRSEGGGWRGVGSFSLFNNHSHTLNNRDGVWYGLGRRGGCGGLLSLYQSCTYVV